jgi:hypothetical protein
MYVVVHSLQSEWVISLKRSIVVVLFAVKNDPTHLIAAGNTVDSIHISRARSLFLFPTRSLFLTPLYLFLITPMLLSRVNRYSGALFK